MNYAQRQVADIAANLPGATQIFRNHKIDFCCGGHVPLAEAVAARGESLAAIETEQGTRGSIRISKTEDKVNLIMPSADPEQGAVRVIRRLAETGLGLAVDRLSSRVGVTVEQVSVRDQTTRWGSCSTTGTLSLNWRLVLLPPLLHDHVILHELSHRRHMDHSDRFWNQLAAWDPDWKKHDRELNKRWNVIMDLGR